MFRFIFLLVAVALNIPAAPSDCVDGTLADYLALPDEGCRLGVRVLSGFELLPLTAGSSQIDPADIDVNPTAMGITGSLLFAVNGNAAGGAVLESIFKLAVTPDVAASEAVQLTLNGVGATGDGVILGLGELCPAGIDTTTGVCTGPSQFLVTTHTALVSIPTAAAVTGPSSYDVSQSFVIDAGLTGSASLTSAQLTFTTVPEPATAAIVATALAVTYLMRRRRAQ